MKLQHITELTLLTFVAGTLCLSAIAAEEKEEKVSIDKIPALRYLDTDKSTLVASGAAMGLSLDGWNIVTADDQCSTRLHTRATRRPQQEPHQT